MKKLVFVILSFVFVFPLFFVAAQQSPENGVFQKTEIFSILSRPPQVDSITGSSYIKGIQTFGARSGVAFTKFELLKTDDNGKIWRQVNLRKGSGKIISSVYFENETNGYVILSDSETAVVELAKTADGGISWTKTPVSLRNADALDTDLSHSTLEVGGSDLTLIFRAPTSSNFVGQIIYRSADGGANWNFSERTAEIRRDDAATNEKRSGNWTLRIEGECTNGKLGCLQETKIFDGEDEITPSYVKHNLFRREKEEAEKQAQTPMFARAPGGATRVSLNRGFDKCTAATVAQMQTWWNASPFYDANIYISGRNRGCAQPQLNAAWVNQVSAMGWGLIPTIVGYQAPCSVSTNAAKHSSDPAVAEQQGRTEADISIADANNLGLTAGTILYYDMERYDETSATPGCRASVNGFLKGWTDRLHEKGYISGVYGSPTNAVADWINLPAASRMDAVWLARWDNIPSVWTYAAPSPAVPTNVWANHQRIKQWQAPHNETWGGVTFNIDGNIADAPVAGAPVAKNKPADFDGDGKTDISVFRPDAGVWFIAASANAAFDAVTFGAATDTLAPADYDADGKTDQAIFRSETGVWYFRTKAGQTSARQFGAAGDIPVPADYNGDGKADVAVFRPSNGVWYIANSDSLGTFTFVQFGQTGDKPVAGDYDADGKTDIAVFRPSNGSWFVLRSSNGGFSAQQFGQNGDVPVPGDYDADGKTDFAVFRAGVWYILRSTAGFTGVQFGSADDQPAPGDYDGDNKIDPAVFRPSNGAWYLLQSQSGFSAVAFGSATDKAIPNAYLPN